MKKWMALFLAAGIAMSACACSAQEDASFVDEPGEEYFPEENAASPEDVFGGPIDYDAYDEASTYSIEVQEDEDYGNVHTIEYPDPDLPVMLTNGTDHDLVKRYPEVPEEFARAVMDCVPRWMDETFVGDLAVEEAYCTDLEIYLVREDEQQICCSARFYFYPVDILNWPASTYKAKLKGQYLRSEQFQLTRGEDGWVITDWGNPIWLSDE